MSRPLLEQHVRRRVHAVPNVTIMASALDRLLRQLSTRSVDGLWRECSRAAATVASIRWNVVSGEDFRFRETTGAGPAPVQLINRYVGQVQRVLTRPHASSRVLTRPHASSRARAQSPPTPQPRVARGRGRAHSVRIWFHAKAHFQTGTKINTVIKGTANPEAQRDQRGKLIFTNTIR